MMNFNEHVHIVGNKEELEKAKEALSLIIFTGDQPIERNLIRWFIDTRGIRADVIYHGVRVYGTIPLIAELQRLIKAKSLAGMTERFADFLSFATGRSCSAIQWNEFFGGEPERLCKYILRNEFGRNLLTTLPAWATDMKEAAQELIALSERWVREWNMGRQGVKVS